MDLHLINHTKLLNNLFCSKLFAHFITCVIIENIDLSLFSVFKTKFLNQGCEVTQLLVWGVDFKGYCQALIMFVMANIFIFTDNYNIVFAAVTLRSCWFKTLE